MKVLFAMILIGMTCAASAQYHIAPYTVVRDSASHTTVLHSGNAEMLRLRAKLMSDTLHLISPDIKVMKGIVDHKSLTGDMLVREYFIDGMLIGYIEYEEASIRRERYMYADGRIYLDKKYDKGTLLFAGTRLYSPTKD